MTGNAIAVRNGSPTGLAIRPGQEMWNDKQRAALAVLGIKDATNADLAVFMHYCQKTGLDPFSRQIYMINRREKQGDKWVSKQTIQVGIDGFRVIRDRIAAKTGVSVEYEDTIWYDAEGQAYNVWLWEHPPAACNVTVVKDGKRFPGVVRFASYAQRNREGDLVSQWRTQPDHMIEKCAEAYALRRAFPNDLGGIYLDDEVPPMPAETQPAQPQRVTAAEIIAHAEPDPTTPAPPAEPATGARSSTAKPAGGRSKRQQGEPERDLVAEIGGHWDRLGIETEDERVNLSAALARVDFMPDTITDLGTEDRERVADALSRCRDIGQVHALISNGDAPEAGDGS